MNRINSNLDDLLGGRDALFDERIPLVAVRALPEQLSRPVATPDAHMWVEKEDRFARRADVSLDQCPIEADLHQHVPDSLVDRQTVRIVRERIEQEIERGAQLAARREVTSKHQSGPPILGISRDELTAALLEPLGRTHLAEGTCQPVEGKVRTLG